MRNAITIGLVIGFTVAMCVKIQWDYEDHRNIQAITSEITGDHY
jgi:hypothetical protein